MRNEKLTPRNNANARAVLEESPRLVEALIKQAYMARLPTGWGVITDLIQFQQRLCVSGRLRRRRRRRRRPPPPPPPLCCVCVCVCVFSPLSFFQFVQPPTILDSRRGQTLRRAIVCFVRNQ